MVICDLEAGVGPVVRSGRTDLVIVVSEPSVKSMDVARRAAAAADAGQVIVVANRVRNDSDVEAIRSQLGEYEMVVVPDDRTIARADEEGRAPVDLDPDAPGVATLLALAERLGRQPAPV